MANFLLVRLDFIVSSLIQDCNRSFYLSFLRVYVSFHIIKKFFFYWPSLELIFGTTSFVVQPTDTLISMLGFTDSQLRVIHLEIVAIIVVLAIFFMFGIGKHFVALLLFLGVEIIQRLGPFVLNGGDNYLKFILLYLTLANSYDFFVLKRLVIKKVGRVPYQIS